VGWGSDGPLSELLYFFYPTNGKKRKRNSMSDSEHSEEGEEGPEWMHSMYETLQSYRDLYQKCKAVTREQRAALGTERRSVLRYLRHTAARKVRSIEAILRDPPAIADAEAAETRASVRHDLFEHLVVRHLRGPALDADDRAAMLATIADPVVRRTVAALTVSKLGVAATAALAIGRLRARVARRAQWHPDGPSARALAATYPQSDVRRIPRG
jgi:hypothetical protein